MRMSRLRWAVLLELAKAWRLNLDAPAARIIRVFNLNSGLVYKFLRELENDGIAMEVGRGRWALRDTSGARALADYVLETSEDLGLHGHWTRTVPEVYYYIAEPPSIEWLGFPGRTTIIVDKLLKGRVDPPKGCRLIYTSMRGRIWRYDWDLRVPRGLPEQSLADLLAHDPDYPVEQYIYNNLEWLNLDEIARRTTPQGLRRLSTFLSFLRMVTGEPVAAGFDYFGLADPAILEERLDEYTGLLFANGVAEARGV